MQIYLLKSTLPFCSSTDIQRHVLSKLGRFHSHRKEARHSELTKVLILLKIGKNYITRGSSQLLYFTYKLSLKHPPTAHIHHSYEEHTDFIRHSSSRVNIFLEETTGKDWMFILKCWINFCSNTLEKQCEHRLSESLTFVRMYRATHIELCEKVCSGEHVYLYLYIYTHTLTSLLHAEESFLKS